jgi:hypothetical protein
MEAMEEEEYGGCDSADPRCRLDDALLSLADGIFLRSIVATMGGAVAMAVGSTATVTMSMPMINIVAFHWAEGLVGQQRQQRRDGGQRR